MKANRLDCCPRHRSGAPPDKLCGASKWRPQMKLALGALVAAAREVLGGVTIARLQRLEDALRNWDDEG